jgi:hypothetical protein
MKAFSMILCLLFVIAAVLTMYIATDKVTALIITSVIGVYTIARLVIERKGA